MNALIPELQFVREPQQAELLLHPLRSRLLELARQPGTAAGLADQLGLPRQRVNYHLRELEKGGLLELVEERRKGNVIERVVRATAHSYLISPETLGELAADPADVQDRLSVAYLVAVAGQVIRDLGILRSRADAADKRLGTFTMRSEIRFCSASDRRAFAEELTEAITRLIAKYHDESATGGRRFKFLTGIYPAITKTAELESNPKEYQETHDE